MSDINHEFRTLDNRGEATRFEYPIETVRGEQGEPGQAATITVGTTTTGEAGTDASVENVGNTADAVLNFTIPKGDKGDTGEKGDKGDKGEKGDKGDTGADGVSPTVGDVVAHSASPESEPAVQIDDENHVLNFTFTIPQGVKGDTGATGAPGLPAVMEAVAEKGDEAHAEVELKDPDTNTYTLKLTLPKGDKGDTPEIPEVVIDSVQWVDTPEEASITPTYDKDHNILNVAFKLPHWKGDKGENGISITFGGVYETLDEAPQQPELNTLITVGAEHHQDLYIYDGVQWQKLGSIAGEKGEQGIQGKAGQSVKFIGYFNGVEDIVTKVTEPELNNMAVVTKEEGARYLALYTGNDWIDLAKISGDKGEAGEKGAPGEPGEPGKPAIIDEVTAIAGDEAGAQLTRLSEEDNTYSILFTVPAGKDGAPGEPGKDGAPGKDGKDGKALTFEELTEEQKDELRGANGDNGAPAIIKDVIVTTGKEASGEIEAIPGQVNSYNVKLTMPEPEEIPSGAKFVHTERFKLSNLGKSKEELERKAILFSSQDIIFYPEFIMDSIGVLRTYSFTDVEHVDDPEYNVALSSMYLVTLGDLLQNCQNRNGFSFSEYGRGEGDEITEEEVENLSEERQIHYYNRDPYIRLRNCLDTAKIYDYVKKIDSKDNRYFTITFYLMSTDADVEVA